MSVVQYVAIATRTGTGQRYYMHTVCSHACTLELKQISEISGYPFEIYYPDTDLEPFIIISNKSDIHFACQINFYGY